MQRAFDNNTTADLKGVFLDISKVYYKVWHNGLLFKFQAYAVKGELLSLFKDYLDNRK